jgi:hypothetical protein
MLNHRDTQTSRTPSDEASRVADFLSVSTFLKPQFRIAVAPTGGELQVQVEARSAEARTRLSSRH